MERRATDRRRARLPGFARRWKEPGPVMLAAGGVLLAAALFGAGGASPAFSAPTPIFSDQANLKCADRGLVELAKFDPATSGTKNGVTIVVGTTGTNTNDTVLSWSSTTPIQEVLVAAGSNFNIYVYNGATADLTANLIAPLNGGGQQPTLSHVDFCVTSVNTPTVTNTPVPGSPTATPTATNTPVPGSPTATPTATNTPVPGSPTATPTATNTPVPGSPTATPTATNTPSGASTATPTPTQVNGGTIIVVAPPPIPIFVPNLVPPFSPPGGRGAAISGCGATASGSAGRRGSGCIPAARATTRCGRCAADGSRRGIRAAHLGGRRREELARDRGRGGGHGWNATLAAMGGVLVLLGLGTMLRKAKAEG